MQIPEIYATNNLPQVTSPSFNTPPSSNKFSNPFRYMNKKQIISLISVFILVIGVIATTIMSQRVQKFFTRASVQPSSYGYGNYGSENYLGFSTIVSPSPISARKPGDVDNNGLVNIFDFNSLVRDFGKIGINLNADFNNNGKVDLFDFNILISNFGR